MSSKIFKNYQINVGVPIQIRPPINFHTLQPCDFENEEVNLKEEKEYQEKESYEEIIARAREEADLILKEVQLEALRMLENAENEANKKQASIEEEARKKGYEGGYNEAKKQYEDLISEAEFIKEHAKTEYKDVLAGIEADVVNVILEVAGKIIGSELSLNKDSVLDLIRQAFEKCENRDSVVLKVAPEDFGFVVENKERLISMVSGINNLEIKKDSSLKAGACIIDTPFGTVDAGAQTKFKKIEEALRSVIGK